MRAVAIKFIREPAPTLLIGAPRPLGLLSFDELRYNAWNVERPQDVVSCVGVDERQALDDAMIKLACAGWKIRLRRALPSVAALPSSRLA